jgi:hypothetical protein
MIAWDTREHVGTIGEGEATTTGDLTHLFHEEAALDVMDLLLEE